MTSQHGAPESQTLGALVHQLSQQIPELIRSEMRLAQAEVAQKGKHAGIGAGMFGAAGLLGSLALGSFVAAGLLGKEQVSEATPAAPERAIHGLKEDVFRHHRRRPAAQRGARRRRLARRHGCGAAALAAPRRPLIDH